MFVLVEVDTYYKIVYDRDTFVMYVVSNAPGNYGNFTLLVNPDGTPKLYKKSNQN